MERSFPRHTGRRAAQWVQAVLCAMTMLAASIAIPAAQADDLEDKHNEVQKHIKHEKMDLEHSSRALRKAAGRLGAARANLRSAQRHWRSTRSQWQVARALDLKMKARLVKARAELATARAELAQGKLDVRNQRDDIGRMAAASYEHGDPALLRLVVIMNSQNPGDMTTQLNVADNIMHREDGVLGGLEETRDRLILAEAKVEAAKVKVEVQKAATRANVVKKRKLRIAARDASHRVARLVKHRKRAAARAAQLQARDRRALMRLRSEEKRIKRQILIRAQAQSGGFSGDTGGFLHRPVPGPVTSPFGYRRHPIYGYWGLHDGTDFRASCGSPLRAGSGGRVVDRYYSSVWGNRLLLDIGRVNGKNMTLTYNHISGYRVGEGARVGRGEVVAYAGNTGWSTACHLHFSVLLNGEPVDPMKYM